MGRRTAEVEGNFDGEDAWHCDGEDAWHGSAEDNSDGENSRGDYPETPSPSSDEVSLYNNDDSSAGDEHALAYSTSKVKTSKKTKIKRSRAKSPKKTKRTKTATVVKKKKSVEVKDNTPPEAIDFGSSSSDEKLVPKDFAQTSKGELARPLARNLNGLADAPTVEAAPAANVVTGGRKRARGF